MRPLITSNFRGGFRVVKSKSRNPLLQNLMQNIQLINLKLLPKFLVARPNRSQVKSKSLNLRTRKFKNGRVKTKEHVTRVSVVPITESLQFCLQILEKH